MKKIIIFITLFVFFIPFSFAEEVVFTCETSDYNKKIQECIDKQKTHRTIKDFVCIQGTTEEIVYQIVLDEKFREVDEEVESYLSTLSESKDYYFGKEKKEDFTAGVDLIEQKLGQSGEYAVEYKKLCSVEKGGIIPETTSCLGDKTSLSQASNFFNLSTCSNLYQVKLSVYKQIAINTLKNNKKYALKDSHKLFTQIQRSRFSYLINLIRINLGYMERLWKKWQSKSKIVH